MATYNAELLSPPQQIIEADKATRDAEIAIEVEQAVPRVSIEPKTGIVRRSTR